VKVKILTFTEYPDLPMPAFFQRLCLVLLLAAFLPGKLMAQASWEPFGQNRVQYRTFSWNYLDSTHFRVFFYDKGKAHAIYALNLAEQELSHIVYMMGGRLNKKLNIVIYNSFTDFRQTNIGRQNEEINRANGGKVDVIGDNIPVYFNGDHLHMKRQIDRGIASVIKDNMLFGDNVKDVVKNAVKMNLPEWYTLGYVAYIADEWTAEKESEIRDLSGTRKKTRFIDLATEQPALVGHSFWAFIASQYGENFISNLLYLTRYRKSVNTALETVFRKPAKAVYAEWESRYKIATAPAAKGESKAEAIEEKKPTAADTLLAARTLLTTLPIAPDTRYGSFAVSTTGNEVAYVTRKDGEFKVMIRDVRYKKNYEVIAGGVRANVELADPDYPMLSWSPTGRKLAVLYLRKNNLYLRIFTTGKRKMENRVIPANRIERITGLCFMSDENTLAVTGIRKGQSDLYKLSIRNARLEAVSQDLFDDRNPVFIENEATTGILFQSNRTSSYIGENAQSDAFNPVFNLFLYDPSKGNNLMPLSRSATPLRHAMQWGAEDYSYVTEEKGQIVRKISKLVRRGAEGDTFSVETASPLPFTLLMQEYVHKTGKVTEVTKDGKEYRIYHTPLLQLQQMEEAYARTHPALPEAEADSLAQAPATAYAEYITPFDSDTSQTMLESLFVGGKGLKQRYQLFSATGNKLKPLRYLSTFYPNFIQTTLDNTLLFTRYQPFDYSAGVFQNPPLSGFFTTSLTDVMEDYKITGGLRVGIDLRSLDYFLQFNNFRKRTDWSVLYYHHSTSREYDQRNSPPPFFSPFPVIGKVNTDLLQAGWTYPFDMLKSIRLQFGTRYDRIRIQATDQFSIGIPDDNQFWLLSRAEFVYDNTVMPLLNIWKGSRAKLFAEYQYKVNQETKGFYNFGYDARNYTGLYRNIILASRLAGAHSGGNAKILYLLGGVDNDVNPQRDANSGIDRSQNYAFQSLATNMRGYRQGNRNGNSFMVLNEEIRFPIYNTLFKRPIKSGFIRNLQLVAFMDVGSAWKGILPNADNIRNNNFVQDPNSPVTVFIEKSPYDFSIGYGAGLRTRLLGYFLRADFAWNIEGSRKPLIHISMATDF
jgi:hypothetical protein